MKKRLSARLAQKLRPLAKPYEVRDDSLKGFILRVQPTGRKTYLCEYARGKRQTIGHVDTITAKQARVKAKEILALHQLPGSVTPEHQPHVPTLRAFIDREYKPWAEVHNKAAAGNLDRIRRHFLRPFGKRPLNEISPIDIEHWRIRRLKAGTNAATVNRDLGTLKAALSKAVQWGFLDVHPLARVKPLKVDNNPNPRFLSEDEEIALRHALDEREQTYRARRESANQWRQERDYTPREIYSSAEYFDHLKPMVLLAMNTGLRRGELFSLRWSDIDLEHRNLTVAGSYSKSGRTRQIPLNDEAVDVMTRWRSQTVSDSELVFAGKSGDRRTNVKKAWMNLLQDAGINHFRWHDLRHHFASKLVMAGVDLNTVRELLGHSTITMTLRYAHLAPEHTAAAVARIAYGTSRTGKVIPFKQRGV